MAGGPVPSRFFFLLTGFSLDLRFFFIQSKKVGANKVSGNIPVLMFCVICTNDAGNEQNS